MMFASAAVHDQGAAASSVEYSRAGDTRISGVELLELRRTSSIRSCFIISKLPFRDGSSVGGVGAVSSPRIGSPINSLTFVTENPLDSKYPSFVKAH